MSVPGAPDILSKENYLRNLGFALAAAAVAASVTACGGSSKPDSGSNNNDRAAASAAASTVDSAAPVTLPSGPAGELAGEGAALSTG